MKDSQLQKMSLRELMDLRKRIDDAIGVRRIDERAELKKKIQAMAEQAGFRVNDLFGNARERAAQRSLAVKYRHPKNHALIWTGRGRRPNWLVQAGGDIERFRVA
jgi:DNA-binding protein H-NS